VNSRQASWLVLIGFAVLVTGATILSASTAARVPDYGSLPPDNAGAAATLYQSVRNTLASNSFTMQIVQSVATDEGRTVGQIKYSVIYQKPDTTILRVGSLSFVVSDGAQNVAGESSKRRPVGTCPFADQLTETPAIREIDLLSGPLSVQRSAGVYTAELLDVRIAGGSVAKEIVVRSTIRNGRLATESISSTTDSSKGDFTLTYSGYGSSTSAIAHPTTMYNAYSSTLCLNATWSGWVGFAPSQG
jgi:hypothetical protein